MSTSFQNACDQSVVFTHQDQDLLEAFHKVKRFQIKDKKDLKGLIINIRDTYMVSTCYMRMYMIHGKPEMSHFSDGTRLGLKFKKAYRIHDKMRYAEKIHVSTLIGYNISFKYNTKVKAFCELLSKADRFQQHCIISNKPYTEESFEQYTDRVMFDISMSRWYSSMP